MTDLGLMACLKKMQRDVLSIKRHHVATIRYYLEM